MARFLSKFCHLFIVLFVFIVFCEGRKHYYEIEEKVPFYVNKVGPYTNPAETYEFYSLPFCQPTSIQHKHTNLGEDLSGDHKVNSLYDIRFRVPVHFQRLCEIHLTTNEIKKFINAIDQYYYYEMFLDDLPLRGFVGTKDEQGRRYLFLHSHFHILWNNNNVIFSKVNASTEKASYIPELDDATELFVEFSYSVSWEETKVKFEDRNKLYVDNFFSKELEIHWLSIMNSCVLVLLLTGFLAIIVMRILKSDYSRYTKLDDEEEADAEDYGWKLLHGDVFRFPPYKNIFCAFVGLGAQSLCTFFGILILGVLDLFHPNNGGALLTALIVLYSLTSFVGGFVSAYFFKQMGGEKWAWNIVYVATLFSIPVLVVFAYDNTLAITYNATAAVPFGSIMIVVLIVSLIGFPLTVVGGITGKRTAGPFEAPVRTKNFPRLIPPIPWYRSLPIQMIMSGFLPFSAIYIELYYIFASVWGHSYYQLFGILFLVAVILIIVTSCITVALTYFQLSMEDHRWWWHSFLSGGSTGFFIYLYSLFYYVYRSDMSGTLQGSFFFTYMGIASYFFFLMLGSVGFYSSLLFIREIYRRIKCD